MSFLMNFQLQMSGKVNQIFFIVLFYFNLFKSQFHWIKPSNSNFLQPSKFEFPHCLARQKLYKKGDKRLNQIKINRQKDLRYFSQLNKFIASQEMHAQHGRPPKASKIQKQDSKIIDLQKIKTILSKKLQGKISNPQQMLQELEDQISYQIQKTENQIEKQRLRVNRIHFVEQRQMKARSSLKQKIESKMQKSQQKKTSQQKKWLEDRLKARKLKEQFIQGKKQQISQIQFKKRFDRFKEIKAQNDPKISFSQDQVPKKQRVSLLRRSLSQRNSQGRAIQKSKQLQELQYFKKLELVEKRRIYQKFEPKIHITETIDKRDWIGKLNSQSSKKFIQKLGEDLSKIEQVRNQKQKQINQKLEKIRKQAELRQQQRGYRLEMLKADINQIQKHRREVLNIKNERFLIVKNKSTPSLLNRNSSYASQIRDKFKESTTGQFLSHNSKMSKTLQNFNQSMQIERAKAEDYMVKDKEKKVKQQLISVISQVLREEKTEILKK